MLEQSLLSAPTREGSPRYLSERASVSICKVSKKFALSKAFVLGGKKILDFAKLTVCPEFVQ
jgi:hypothetical protein